MKHSSPVHSDRTALLEPHRREIERCVKCGTCSTVCPAYLLERRESQSPRGRMALVQALLDGRLAVSNLLRDRLATCMGCLACEAACPSGVPVTTIIQQAREYAAAESGTGLVSAAVSGVLGHPLLFRATAWLAPFAFHYGRNAVRASGAGRGKRKRQGKRQSSGTVTVFPGCAIDGFQRDIGRSVTAVLEYLGYRAVIPQGLKCCGRPLLALGNTTASREHAEHNAAVLAAAKGDAIVTACASCGLTFKRDYPKLLRSSGAPVVLDIHEFLVAALQGVQLGPVRKRVTWHDPCHLGRGQGLGGTARDVLRMVPGLELVEMENPDRCCGFGGTMRMTHRRISDGVAKEKALTIIDTGASVLVTGCPGCRMQTAEALSKAGSDIDAIHTVQVLEEAIVNRERDATTESRHR